MARSRVGVAPPGQPERKPVKAARSATASPYALRGTRVTPGQIGALQQTAGNAAARRVAAGTAPRGPQRLWSVKEFSEATYEGMFTARSSVQIAIEKMIADYLALPTPKNKPTAAHANMLM